MIPLNKPSEALVVDLINDQNPDAELQLNKVILEAPIANDDEGATRNSLMSIKARKNSGYRDSVDVTYDRLNLPAVFRNVNVFLNVHTPASTADLLPELNRLYGLSLAVEDITSTAIPANTNPPLANPDDEDPAPVPHTIAVKADCYAYTGQLQVMIGARPQVGERLSLVITKTELDGLQYPNGKSDTKGQAYIYSYGTDCTPIATFLKGLAAGTAIDDTALAVELNKVFAEEWVALDASGEYNLKGATVTFAGPTETTTDGNTVAEPGANTDFNSLVKVLLTDKCTNFTGELYLHYNAA